MTPAKPETKLVRTSILIPEETDRAIRDLAEKRRRPLTWEIRLAIEKHVENERTTA